MVCIQKRLGHNDITTTLHYLQVTNKHLVHIISPLDDIEGLLKKIKAVFTNRHNKIYELRTSVITHWLVGDKYFCVKMECGKNVRIYLSWWQLKLTR